jgi:hypothetical protein
LAAVSRRCQALSGRVGGAYALLFYLILSLTFFGGESLGSLDSVCVCGAGKDPTFYEWSLVWWPHALSHLSNPFWTDVVWPPEGLNLAQSAGVPSAALLGLPVTLLAGPLVTYNVLVLLGPALAAWSTYLLCRELRCRNISGSPVV